MESQAFVEGYKAAHGVIVAHLEGISHEESLVPPKREGNCLNWIAGHLLATRGHALELLGGKPFLAGEEAQLYGMGSKPIRAGSPCVKLERLVEGLHQTGEDLIGRLRETGSEELSRELDPGQFPIPVEDPRLSTLLALLMFHEGYHSGQLCLGRRLLGKPSGLGM